jgi:hypothetical protein
MLGLLTIPTIAPLARADSFFADFSCNFDCNGVSKTVPMHFNETDGRFHGTAHWDTLLWDFFLPDDWATGQFYWQGFVDTSSNGNRFLTFRIIDISIPYYQALVEYQPACPTERSCLPRYNDGNVVFRDPPSATPEPAEWILIVTEFTAFVAALLLLNSFFLPIASRLNLHGK